MVVGRGCRTFDDAPEVAKGMAIKLGLVENRKQLQDDSGFAHAECAESTIRRRLDATQEATRCMIPA